MAEGAQTRQSTGIKLSKSHIIKSIEAVKALTNDQRKSKNALFEDESDAILLQVTCIKIPKTPTRQLRMLLPNSIVSATDDVALFVPDLQRGRRKDYEPTVVHYQTLLKKCGCTRIKDVIPMNRVRNEFDQYELKRKLLGSYDFFLIDGKIAGHVSHMLGKHFWKKRKLPTPVKMQSKDLKLEIDIALQKTSMQLHSLGNSHVVQIGHTAMMDERIRDNVIATCKQLAKYYPGGWKNIRSIHIKTPKSLAVPIYFTTRCKNLVKVPVVEPRRPKAYETVEGELTTLSSNAKVALTPEGDIRVYKRIKKKFYRKKD
ncbi:ribosomal L1 domain-containing protein CG13096 [Orussus abietinus]|uniref:ribosomal L1 domain-containing protein CG13096 n=1 Tax=Orussus abietinus TaxID=222816 RepID=UPI000625D00F|nr:ribosomal L1 domain-containing protein CG13096 [Orussus abietinus]